MAAMLERYRERFEDLSENEEGEETSQGVTIGILLTIRNHILLEL